MSATPRPIREGLFVADDRGTRLVSGVCDRCHDLHFPRTDTCPYCGGPVSERLVGPDGVVVLCTVVTRRPPGYAGPVPYGFGVVQIVGTRLEIVSRISATDPGATRPGACVRLVLEPLPDEDGSPATVWTFQTVDD